MPVDWTVLSPVSVHETRTARIAYFRRNGRGFVRAGPILPSFPWGLSFRCWSRKCRLIASTTRVGNHLRRLG